MKSDARNLRNIFEDIETAIDKHEVLKEHLEEFSINRRCKEDLEKQCEDFLNRKVESITSHAEKHEIKKAHLELKKLKKLEQVPRLKDRAWRRISSGSGIQSASPTSLGHLKSGASPSHHISAKVSAWLTHDWL